MKNEPANRIAQLRKSMKMTQQQLADCVGAHWITISKLERGEMRLNVQWMERLAPCLNVDPMDLYVSSEKPFSVQLMGRTSEGGEVSVFPNDSPKQLILDSNFLNDPDVHWIQIGGRSLHPWFNQGDYIAVKFSEIDPRFAVGRFCLLLTNEQDGTVARRFGLLAASNTPGRFDLQFGSAPPIQGLDIANIAPSIAAFYSIDPTRVRNA